MADLSDVETALVQAALDAIYPSGIALPSCIGSPVRVFRGEPVTATLERDVGAGVGNVSVFASAETSRNTTRWMSASSTVAGTPTLEVETAGNSVTFSGAAGAGQVAGVLVDGQAFAHRGGDSDTPSLVAATLAAAIGKARTCWLSGATLTVPACHQLLGRVVADGSATSERCRQEQSFTIGVWCVTPEMRDRVAGLIHARLASIAFLALADGSSGRLRYRSTVSTDKYQAVGLYRRDLAFDVEYGTTATESAPAMLFGDLVLAGNATLA